MKRFRTGLVVGKFCPLHRGHQHLLDHAAAACGELLIVSWAKPGFAGHGADRRERWLAALYPDALRCVLDDARLAEMCRRRGLAPQPLPDNGDGDDAQRGFVAWLLETVLQVDVEAVFTSEAYGDGFAAALARAQQARGGPAVVHVAVDPARAAVSVSGTALRADVHGLRGFLDPRVYRDFVHRVGILGGESSGKTTLAEFLAQRCASVHAAEFGRELWLRKDGVLGAVDLLHVARTQIRREETRALEANRVLFCDTTPLTTLLYAQAMPAAVPAELEVLARRPYDLVLLCGPDVPFVQDGTRRDAGFRQWQHDWYLRELPARGIRYRRLDGDWEDRRATALACLRAEFGLD